MTLDLKEALDQEGIRRGKLAETIINIVMGAAKISHKGCVNLGLLQCFVWNKLGFHGNVDWRFSSYMNRIMMEEGFRPVIRHGYRKYVGLELIDPNSEDLPVRYPGEKNFHERLK